MTILIIPAPIDRALTRDKDTPDANEAPVQASRLGMSLAAVRRRTIAGHAKPIDICCLDRFKQGVSYPKSGEDNRS
ncbi:hypothetical protein ABIB80_007263 [Bradyrhizobium sp. i1.15.2]|uniref:hypothetical protein n=1 Tax=Bradyrhizobium sp. i1.15.2 TaxID=3156362 RepID=UPI003393D2A7